MKKICCNISYAIGVVLTAALAACAPVGPDYQPPSPQIPAQWSGTNPSTVIGQQTTQWWTLFGDPLLDSLINRAAAANKDLRIAKARIREARAQRVIATATGSLTAGVSSARSRRSDNTTSTGGTDNLFQTGFDAEWELDLFGGTRRAGEAAEATLSAAQEDLQDTLVSLESEVARNYIELRGNQKRLAVARENIASQEKTVDLVLGRFKLGLGNELDLANARTELSMTKSQVPALQSAVKQAMHQLAILLGQPPESLVVQLAKAKGIPPVPVTVPINLPSELLRQRPDIRAAERRLAAATAEIGVATADLFPRFSLSALLGVQSTDLSNLITTGSRYWSFGPSLSLSLFDQGKARAGIEIRNAQRDSALALYEKTVLTALADVENALTAFSHEKETARTLSDAVASGKKAVDIANGMYESGLTDFLNVLQSEHALYLSQDQLVQSNQRLALDTVAIFKAMGGGWKEETTSLLENKVPSIAEKTSPQNHIR